MRGKTSSSAARAEQQAKVVRKRRRGRVIPMTSAELADMVAQFKGPIQKCPDGRAMGSMKSFDMGLVI
jgi:hypothetical protein